MHLIDFLNNYLFLRAFPPWRSELGLHGVLYKGVVQVGFVATSAPGAGLVTLGGTVLQRVQEALSLLG